MGRVCRRTRPGLEADVTVQNVIVALIVASAVVFVSRRAWRTLRKAKPAGGSGCNECGCGDH